MKFSFLPIMLTKTGYSGKIVDKNYLRLTSQSSNFFRWMSMGMLDSSMMKMNMASYFSGLSECSDF